MVAFRLRAGRYKVTCRPGSHTTDKTSRKMWGCDERAEFPVFPDPITGSFRESKHYDLHRCPACQVGPEWVDVIDAWSVFGSSDHPGPMPVSGGWMDQTQWFADAHAILAGERAKYLDAMRKEAERKR